MNVHAEKQAVAAFPELCRLIDLRDEGWAFLATERDGKVVEVHGVRTWPGGWADAIRVRYTTDAKGLRTDYAGGIVRGREGTLDDVLDGLIALPAPDERGAPRLVKGTVDGIT
ncbi:MAG: hypothetical protein ABIQ18_47425 [Umezawaea sp.]